MSKNERVRGWVFTVNNYTTDDVNRMLMLLNYCDYGICGFEICPTTGTPHLQGACWRDLKMSFNTITSWMPRARVARMKGTCKDQDYCNKDGHYYVYGTIPPGQGKRTDIDNVRQIIKDGGGMTEVLENCRSYQACRFAELYIAEHTEKRRWKPTVVWIFGGTGVGKTRYVMDKHPDAWISGKNLKWWNGYCDQEVTLFDDFRKDFCTFHELLRILDRYPYTVEIKGSSRQLVAKKMYITSCYPPEKVYHTREDVKQLIRRIDLIVEMHEGGKVTRHIPNFEDDELSESSATESS